MPAATHNDVENLNYQVVSTLNRANTLGLLTDAGVAAADTKQGLINFVNSITLHNDQENLRLSVVRAINASGIVDADVLSLTTVAGLIAVMPVTTTSQEMLQ